MSEAALGRWLAEGPFHLALSSGFFGFYAHAGFLAALVEAGHRPVSVSGSSAGALVAGCYAAGLEPEVLVERILALERSDFWDPRPGLGLLAGRRILRRLGELLPVGRVEDCPVDLAVSVYDVARRRTRVLTSGPLPEALLATCAVPVLFQPVAIDGRWYLDGGIADRPGTAGSPPGRRVLLHHLPPAARPGVAPGDRVLDLGRMPPVGPFRLAAGRAVLAAARERTAGRLVRPVVA